MSSSDPTVKSCNQYSKTQNYTDSTVRIYNFEGKTMIFQKIYKCDLFRTMLPLWFYKCIKESQGNTEFCKIPKHLSAAKSELEHEWVNWPNFWSSYLGARFKKRLFFLRKSTPTGTSNPPRHPLRAFKG